MSGSSGGFSLFFFLLASFSFVVISSVFAGEPILLRLGSEQFVQAGSPPANISLSSYTVPTWFDWDSDGDKDLIVGAKHTFFCPEGICEAGKVYVYLNRPTAEGPSLDAAFFAQADGNDLACPVSGCLACFPRVVYWDSDQRKDLLVGKSDGRIQIFLNVATEQEPAFDEGTFLQAGPAGSKTDIFVVARACPAVTDWNNDGKKDLVVGSIGGRIYLFINEGTDTEPDFVSETFVKLEDGNDLVVPSLRSSPDIIDLDGDGKKDILTGDTEGRLLFYSNIGTDAAPVFSDYWFVEADSVPINLPDQPRSRPFVCDWTDDGYFDVLIGAGDGKVHLYQSMAQVGDINKDYVVDLADFALFADYWMVSECGLCGGVDFTNDHMVDLLDMEILVENYLLSQEW
ncbi:MAG: VCBS repeat-containing protein [Planctomycetota bacterium]